MEDITRKGRVGPPKSLAVPALVGESQVEPANYHGNRPVGATGLEPQGDAEGQAAGSDWLMFVASVVRYTTKRGNGYVLAASYPDPGADSIDAEYLVPVKTGPRGVVNIHGHLLNI